MSRRVVKRSAASRGLLALFAAVLCTGVATADEAARSYQFDTTSQSLTQALKTYAQTTRQQIIFTEDLVAGRNAPAMKGEYTAQAALDELLKGTGLIVERSPSGALMIRKLPATLKQSDTAGNTLVPLHLAQAELSTAAPASTADSRAENPNLEEVVVTGSHIRGADGPAGSKVIVIDRSEIERSGYATVQDVMKALPQNFGGGTSTEDTARALNATDNENLNGSTGLNLRGLGSDSTLVLVNGRRQPAGALNGAFIDISSIATSAIERIEVLTDGASAIYGSDAVGGVVNLVLRKNYDGAETHLRYGTLDGDADEMQASQLFGTSWTGGSALVGYQFYKREALARTDRSYTASDDLSRFGGTDYRTFNGNPGTILSLFGTPLFAIPAGQDGTGLTAADVTPGANFNDTAPQSDLLPQQRVHSAFFNATQRVGDKLELFAEGRFGTRFQSNRSGGVSQTLMVPSTNPFFFDPGGGAVVTNPFTGQSMMSVGYSFYKDLGPIYSKSTTDTYTGALGANLDLAHEWRASLAGTYGQEKTRYLSVNQINQQALALALANPDPQLAFNPFGDGSNTNPAVLASIRAERANRASAKVRTGNLTFDGPLATLPAGVARLAVGFDRRQEDIDTGQTLTGLPTTTRDIGRRISAVFAELAVPLIGGDNALPGIKRLELSLAGRHEHYSDFGGTTNPKVGLKWMPIESLTFRGSWGKSFKAPKLVDLLDSPAANLANLAAILSIPDPLSTSFNHQSPVLVMLGGNPNLNPETARTWNAGFDLTPPMLPKLSLSVTYFNIEYKNRIATGGPSGNPFGVLLEEEIWKDLITRNPTQAQLDAACNGPQFNPIFGTCASNPPVAIADLRLRNLASVKVHGFDLDLRQALATGFGSFNFGVNASYVMSFDRAVSSSAPEVDLINTVGNPQKLRARGSVEWNLGNFGAGGFLNFSNSYKDNLNLPHRDVASWTTLDLQLSYRPSMPGWLFKNTQLAINAVNVFDKDPPFVNSQFNGYDTANADPLGRVISIQITESL